MPSPTFAQPAVLLRLLLSLSLLLSSSTLLITPTASASADMPAASPSQINVSLGWNTFLGSNETDSASGIARDGSGNLYVTGESRASWGSPIDPYAGDADVFVAKLDSSGALLWHTFLGSTEQDSASEIYLDESGNIYVGGQSWDGWGSPVRAFAGGDDAFAAKLDPDGNLLWHTFLGYSGHDYGHGIAADGSGNVYVVGGSSSGWGDPVNLHSGGSDTFAAKLNTSGQLQWHTFYGPGAPYYGHDIAVDGSGNVAVTGNYETSKGDYNIFAIKFDSSGQWQWTTTIGTLYNDESGRALTMTANGSLYLTGESKASWGDPIIPHYGGGYTDLFVAQLNKSGELVWNTFSGTSAADYGHGISLNSSGHLLVAGSGYFDGIKKDAFLLKLDGSGTEQWRLTFGAEGVNDSCAQAVADNSGLVYAIGYSNASWGDPRQPFHGSERADAYVTVVVDPVQSEPGIYLPLIIRH